MKADWDEIKSSVTDLFHEKIDTGLIDDEDWADMRSVFSIIDILANELQKDATTSFATVIGYLDFMNFKSPVIKVGLLMAVAPLKYIKEDVYEDILQRIKNK